MASRNKAAARGKQKKLSWELIGIVAILGLVAVFVVVALANRGEAGVPEAPTVLSKDPSVGLDAPEMSGVDGDGRPFLGSADAPVAFYEFADFQCPHCRDFSLFLGKDIKRDLVATGKAKLVWVNFPFMDDGSGEDESLNAAMAMYCGGQQGGAWEMHDWIFTNQSTVANSGAFNRQRLRDLAVNAGLDIVAYDKCMQDPAAEAFAKGDKDFAISKSVQSTPAFMVAGQEKLFEGTAAEQINGLRQAIEAAAGG